MELADKIYAHFDRDAREIGSLFDRVRNDGTAVHLKELEGSEARKELVLLAFLDTMGYATRRKTKKR